MPLSGPVCPECGATAILQDASAVYGPKFQGRGNIWTCANYPECDSYVGCSVGPVPKPLGTLAGRRLRRMRKVLYDLIEDRDAKRKIWWMNEDQCRAELARLGIATQKGIYDE